MAEPEELTATELMQEFWKSPDELALAVEIRRRLERLEKCEAAVRTVFGRGGCACIKDLPGDNYTCTAHETLYRIAHAALEE